MNVGRALRKLNQTAAAEEAYQRALSLFPSPKKGTDVLHTSVWDYYSDTRLQLVAFAFVLLY